MFSRRYYQILLTVAIIFLLLASAVEYYGEGERANSWLLTGSTYIGFFRELGFAFFIAFVILLTVERYNAEVQKKEADEERERLKRDVFEAVFGVSLPRNVRDAVQNEILSKKFYRTNSRSTYEIIPKVFDLENGGEINGVLLKVHSSFSITNVSRNKEIFPFEIFVEKPQLKNLKNYKRDVDIDSVTIGGEKLCREEIDAADKDAPDDLSKRLIKKIEISPGEMVTIDFSFSTIRGHDDSELWITLWPNNGMRFEVNLPPELGSYGVFPIHESRLIQTHNSPETGFHAWELRDTVLPNQGIMFWWRLTDGPDMESDEETTPMAPAGAAEGNDSLIKTGLDVN